MKKNDNHLLKSVSIVLLSLVAFLLIIAIFVKFDEYEKRSFKINTVFEGDSTVQLTNKLPISDSIGKNYDGTGMEKDIESYKSFSISNPNNKRIDYDIYLTKSVNEISDIRSSYIKLYLTDDKNVPVAGFDSKVIKSYYELYSLNGKPASQLLYSGSLAKNATDKFILRSWVADTYIISKNVEDFNFDIEVRIK